METNTAPDIENLLTVAQAAAALKISERALRRVIAHEENAAQVVKTTRRTKTGERTAVLLPPRLIEDIQDQIDNKKTPAETRHNTGGATQRRVHEKSADIKPPDTEHGVQIRQRITAPIVSAVYERLLAQQESQINDLHAAIESEREARRAAEETTKRTQDALTQVLSANRDQQSETEMTKDSDPPSQTLNLRQRIGYWLIGNKK